MLFGNTPEKRIAREAHKVASLKEDLDAISWGRVLDIGKQLQAKEAGEVSTLGAELVSIAQTNLSLATRLGIDPASREGRVMASGMKIMEGGLAEAALDGCPDAYAGENAGIAAPEADAANEDAGAAPAPRPDAGPDASTDDDALSTLSIDDLIRAANQLPANEAKATPAVADALPADSSDDAFDPQEPPARVVRVSTTELPIDLPRLPRFEEVLSAASAPRAKGAVEARADDDDGASADEGQAEDPEPVSRPADQIGAGSGPKHAAQAGPMRAHEPKDAPVSADGLEGASASGPCCAPAGAEEKASADASGEKGLAEAASDPVRSAAQPEQGRPGDRPAPTAPSEPAEQPHPPAAGPSSRPASEPEPGFEEEPGAPSRGKHAARGRFARFRNLYESRDGSLCVFEDEHGHLVAVDSSKLA